ncbi:TonB-dependent receptor [Oceanicoccus sp. KOV_DT_Chl]|uniref:TonB-dependent receptor n=1 Tax=Oceanicoccus sp. KOV_DT_Chl TaxID=1904639 RepID=UPI000C7A22F8|nr:TonB-dependent receptor [Oceanicoccus sp. KOV_DT_Chl]
MKFIFATVMALLPTLAGADDELALFDLSLEELMRVPLSVSARKRDEKMQDVPVAVTAFDSKAIRHRHLWEITDIASHTPSMTSTYSSSSASNTRIFLRGLGQGESSVPTAEAAVGLYIDNVYVARLNGSNWKLFDVAQIEVLRGPQGTLYGRNSTTGALKIMTNAPTEKSAASLTVSAGSRSLKEYQLVASGSLIEQQWLGRIALIHSDQESYIDRYDSAMGKVEEDLGDRGYQGGRLTLDYVGSQALDARINVYQIDDDGDGLYVTPINANTQSLAANDLYSTLTSQQQFSDVSQSGASLHLDWTLAFAEAKSITAYRTVEDKRLTDISGQDSWYIDQMVDTEQYTQEFQLSSNNVNSKLQWITGMFFLYENNSADLLNTLFGGAVTSRQVYDVETKSYAAYGEINYQTSNSLEFTLGGRFTRDNKEFLGSTTNTGGVFTDGSANLKETFNSFTPKAAIDYTVNDNASLYISAAKGFKAGGFQGRGFQGDDLNQSFDPEEVWTYEVGLKQQWVEQRLRFNITYYYNDFKDLQLNSLNPVSGGTIIQNAAEASVQGLELELSYVPTMHLQLYGNFATANGDYKKLSPDISNVTPDSDIAETPSVSSTLGFDYTIPVKLGGEFIIGGDYQHRSHSYPGSANVPSIMVPRLDLFNAFINYTSANKVWDIGLYGKNLGDKEYHFTGFSFSNFESVYAAEPRTIRLTGTYRF